MCDLKWDGHWRICIYLIRGAVKITVLTLDLRSVANLGSDAFIRGGMYFLEFKAVWTCHKLGENLGPQYRIKNSSFLKEYDVGTQNKGI